MEEQGEPPPHELIQYQKYISWGKLERHLPPETDSAIYHHYFNMVHAIFSAWEAAKYEQNEDSERPTTPPSGSSGATPSRSAPGLANSPRADDRMKDSRPGRRFPTIKSS